MVRAISFLPFTFLLFILALFLLLLLSGAEPIIINPRPQELRSLKIQETPQVGRGCSYTVSIKTSCSSRRITRDMISIDFGDAYGNQVYAARLDDPSRGTFERCSTDTFKIQGPCGYGICYLYLLRTGYDGWIPDSVKVYDSYNGRSTTFFYNSTPLPNSVWYGFDHCTNGMSRTTSSSSTSSSAATHRRTAGDPLTSQM